MHLPISSELEGRLNKAAAQQGKASSALVIDAIERMLQHDEWFCQEVAEGLAAADRGELIDSTSLRGRVADRFPG